MAVLADDNIVCYRSFFLETEPDLSYLLSSEPFHSFILAVKSSIDAMRMSGLVKNRMGDSVDNESSHHDLLFAKVFPFGLQG